MNVVRLVSVRNVEKLKIIYKHDKILKKKLFQKDIPSFHTKKKLKIFTIAIAKFLLIPKYL